MRTMTKSNIVQISRTACDGGSAFFPSIYNIEETVEIRHKSNIQKKIIFFQKNTCISMRLSVY